MEDSQDRRNIESILREPLTRNRFFLNSAIRAAQDAENPKPFLLEDLKGFLNGIRVSDPEFKREILNVLEAVRVGQAPQRPRFDTPEKQLVWGAAFAYLKLNPDAMKSWQPAVESGELSGSALWKQVTGTQMAYQELLSHAHHVREALRDKDTKYAWGEPGSGFTYARQQNIINIDLMQAMIVGFEHARADVYREIGHALLSVSYPKRMQWLYKEMQPLLQKSRKAAAKKGSNAKKGPKLKPEEYKRLRLLSAEWSLRQMMFNAAEENVANRFVANVGQQMLQDYGVSLNNTAVTQRAIGLTRLPEDKDASVELRRYLNLCNAVQLSFFQNNGLFDNTDADWFRVGVDPNMVRKTATLAKRPEDDKNDTDGIAHADFAYLRELCGGPKGLENLQPKQHERLYGWTSMVSSVAHSDHERKVIIEEIWKLYGEDLIQSVLKQANDQIDQQMKEAKEKQQQQGEGEDQDGEDQDGEEQDGDEGQSSSKPQKGKKGKKSKSKHGQQQGEPQDADDIDNTEEEEQDSQDDDGQKSDKQKGDKQKGDKKDGKKGDEQRQEGEKGDQKGEGAEGKLGTDDDESVPVEDVGDMPSVEKPSETPGDELEPGDGDDADGKDAEGKDADADDAGGDAESMEDLEKNSEKPDQDGDKADGEDGEEADGAKAGKGNKPSNQNGKSSQSPGKGAGHGDGRSLSDLAKQDWADYPKRIAELSGVINRVRVIFKEIQKKQLQRKVALSRTLSILPENGEVKDRFNMEAHRALAIKKLTGTVEENDLKRFYTDENKFVPAELDIVIMIDGSGSMGSAMNGWNSGKPTPLQSALQAAAILYEAAAGKDMHMNVYVGMWGDSNPPIMIKPGDDRVLVGKAMERMRTGMQSGTDFAPAVAKVAKTIGEQRGKSGTLSGFTHVLVLSDGDAFDVDKSKESISTMFKYSDKVTFDVAIITATKGTNMEKMAKGMPARKPSQEMGVVLGDNPNEVPMAIVGLLLDKVRKCGSFIAVPNSQKRRAMKKAHNKMGPK